MFKIFLYTHDIIYNIKQSASNKKYKNDGFDYHMSAWLK